MRLSQLTRGGVIAAAAVTIGFAVAPTGVSAAARAIEDVFVTNDAAHPIPVTGTVDGAVAVTGPVTVETGADPLDVTGSVALAGPVRLEGGLDARPAIASEPVTFFDQASAGAHVLHRTPFPPDQRVALTSVTFANPRDVPATFAIDAAELTGPDTSSCVGQPPGDLRPRVPLGGFVVPPGETLHLPFPEPLVEPLASSVDYSGGPVTQPWCLRVLIGGDQIGINFTTVAVGFLAT